MHGSHGPSDVECQVEMIWNWNTVGSCFLAESWHIQNNGMMAASVIGVALLAALLEICRRIGRNYDDSIAAQFQRTIAASAAAADQAPLKAVDTGVSGPRVVAFRASPLQQLVRAIIHAIIVAVAYILMLIVMSFNGYIILAVFVGAGLGKFLGDWKQVHIVVYEGGATRSQTTEETQPETVCCG